MPSRDEPRRADQALFTESKAYKRLKLELVVGKVGDDGRVVSRLDIRPFIEMFPELERHIDAIENILYPKLMQISAMKADDV